MKARALGIPLGATLLLLLVLPVVALLLATSPADLLASLNDERLLPALWLSVTTSLCSLTFIVVTGLPLAAYLADSKSMASKCIFTLTYLPIVIPPAVIGVALLLAFGRQGLLGDAFALLGIRIPFTKAAVVFAQIVVAAPFFVQSATEAFRRVPRETRWVARSLGASKTRTFIQVTIPLAFPGLMTGAALSLARALGEFGATLLFAGNMPGKTQTLPLAIFSALESDIALANALSILLCALGASCLIVLVRFVPRGTDT